MPFAAQPPAPGETYAVFEGTFPSEPKWIDDEPDPDHPAGREVIEFLLKAVDPALPLSEIWNEESFGWAFNCPADSETVNVLVQYVDHWLVIVNAVGILPRMVKGKAYDRAVLDIARRLHGALVASDRVTRLRWMTEEAYDALKSDNPFA